MTATVTAVNERERIDQTIDSWADTGLDVDVSAIKLGLLLNAVTGRGHDAVAAELQSHGLTTGEFDVLVSLLLAPGHELSPTEIARAGMLSPAGTTHRVDRLEEAGLVGRRHDSADRRAVRVSLTQEGLARVSEAAVGHARVEAAMLAGLPDVDRDHLARILADLLDLEDAVFDG